MDMTRLESGLRALETHMSEVGYSEKSVSDLDRYARWAISSAPSADCWEDVLAEAASRWRNAGTLRAVSCSLRICRQFDEEGILPRTDESRRFERACARDGLCPGFAAVVDAYEAGPTAARKRPTTVRGEASNASSFLARLQALGRSCPEEVTEDDVISVLTGPDGGPAYSASHVKRVRAVLSGASSVEGVPRLLSFVVTPRRWRKVADALSAAEREAVSAALADDASGLSQRDRAIGCLLLYAGLRPSDVAALRCDAIDWEGDAIRLTQQKTGLPLELPLLPSVGNAIFDYVTGERGGSRDPHLFLSERWPYGGMQARTVCHVADGVLAAAGVRRGEGDRRGARIFRAGVATSMMSDGADRAVISAALGHAEPSSTERYMCADVEGLRRRALDVSCFPLGKGALA